MSKRNLRHKALFSSSVLIVALAIGAVAGAVATNAGATTASPPTIPGFTFHEVLLTQYGMITKSGRACPNGGPACRYAPLPGTLVQIYSRTHKLLATRHTNAKGLTTFDLPKDHSTVLISISHAPWHGFTFGSHTFTGTGPIYLPPGQNITLTFCVTGAASGCVG